MPDEKPDLSQHHPIGRFVYEQPEADVENDPSFRGAWLRFTLLNGQKLQGIAWYEPADRLIGIQREFPRKPGESKWAASPTWLPPQHVVTVSFAEAGAETPD